MTPTAKILYGTPVVPGVVHGRAWWLKSTNTPQASCAPQLPQPERSTAVAAFEQAANTVAARLSERAANAIATAAEVLAVSASMAEDPAWREATITRIESGLPAEQALVAATKELVEQFERIGGRMEERTVDLLDVRDRILAELAGRQEPQLCFPDHPVILLAYDIAPVDAASLDPTKILAVVTEMGGPTSHMAIISRQLGIPCIVAAREIPRVTEGAELLVDAKSGIIQLDMPRFEAERALEREARRQEGIRSWRGPGQTADGVRVQLLANVQDSADARRAADGEAEGIGLLRTELTFLHNRHEPSLAVQAQEYARVFSAFPGQRVVVRTLDSGSDKPAPFIPLEDEANPALGVRGLRTSGRFPEVLFRQLDAIAEACRRTCSARETWVMAPMVSTVPEVRWFSKLCRERGLIPGIMVEVPSVAVQARRFLPEVDFVSIGTNDLAQYVMAADRMSPHLAEYTDPWQPAVLELTAHTVRVARELGKAVGVCGEAAADPLLACILVGMGVTSLSIAAPSLPAVGAQLASVTLSDCQEAAVAVADALDPGDARARARQVLHY